MAQDEFYHVDTEAKRLTSQDVTDIAMKALQNHFQLDMEGKLYSPEHIWSVVLAAATERTTIESACATFRDVPSPNTVRNQLKELFGDEESIDSFEESLNQLLLSQVPKVALAGSPVCAVDITELPYHGDYDVEEDLVRRSKAKSGTTHFHCYASLYIATKHKRYTIALTFVKRSDMVLDALKRLMSRAKRLDLIPKRLLLDREFDHNGAVEWLKLQPFTSVMPLKIQGKQGGTRVFLETNKSYKTRYTRRSKTYGPQELNVWIVCRYQKGKYGKYGMVRFAYVVIGELNSGFSQLYEEYRKRFGIECSYRMMNEVRGRTTSKSVMLRFFFVCLGFMLVNLHSLVKWNFLYFEGRRGPRQILSELLPLQKLRLWIFDVLKRRLGFADQIVIPLSSGVAVY